jgi:uncharacterized circularly permuted ATP-grasp superfamily protein
VRCLRAGNAVIANAVGTGIADDKAVFAYTPRMIKYYLNEEPILPIVETHLLRDPDVREFVLRDLERYVIKPTGASGGYGVVIGPKASGQELAETRAANRARPGRLHRAADDSALGTPDVGRRRRLDACRRVTSI